MVLVFGLGPFLLFLTQGKTLKNPRFPTIYCVYCFLFKGDCHGSILRFWQWIETNIWMWYPPKTFVVFFSHAASVTCGMLAGLHPVSCGLIYSWSRQIDVICPRFLPFHDLLVQEATVWFYSGMGILPPYDWQEESREDGCKSKQGSQG